MKQCAKIFIFLICILLTTLPVSAQSAYNHHGLKSCIPGYRIKKKKDASFFQGNRKTKNYFEGWYFKMVSANGASILSVIPGISISKNGEEQHAFIQVIDGKTAQTRYFSFPAEDFSYSEDRFAVSIGENFFCRDSLVLNIINDSIRLTGTLYLSNQTTLTKNGKRKNIMGWYRRMPFMQCYHGVVSLDHSVNGTLNYNGNILEFKDGDGYIEKDWGRSMPEAWIWMQTNSFNSPGSSFMLSVAKVPWMGHAFTGFLGFFHHDSITTRFGTYSKAKLNIDQLSSDTLNIVIKDKKYHYYITAVHKNSGLLKAPVNGAMDRRIAESVDAVVFLTVTNRNGEVIFEDRSNYAGLEIVGDTKLLNQ